MINKQIQATTRISSALIEKGISHNMDTENDFSFISIDCEVKNNYNCDSIIIISAEGSHIKISTDHLSIYAPNCSDPVKIFDATLDVFANSPRVRISTYPNLKSLSIGVEKLISIDNKINEDDFYLSVADEISAFMDLLVKSISLIELAVEKSNSGIKQAQ